MKLMVVGGGGREHAISWKLSKSPLVEKVYAAPGNAGMEEVAERCNVGATDIDGLLQLSKEKGVDLVVVGPEAPLVGGITDRFRAEGIKIFGFSREAARLEGSKVWAKEFMKRHNIPTGSFEIFTDPDDVMKGIAGGEPPFVIKADGLAAGKGVIIAESGEEAREAVSRLMVEKVFGSAGERVIVEEFLKGEEVSILAVFDGKDYRLFVPSQDHKRAYDGDEGPNTGGMGAYAPVPLVNEELRGRIVREIVEPTFNGIIEEGLSSPGVLYFGLIITEDGPRVLEYNCRFGDPETQVILPLLDSDLAEVVLSAVEGDLGAVEFSNISKAAVCVVIASGGYPGSYKKGYEIKGLQKAMDEGCVVFHAGTERVDGKIVTSGGRVLGVTALGDNLEEALRKAYRGVEVIDFENSFYRKDIAARAFK